MSAGAAAQSHCPQSLTVAQHPGDTALLSLTLDAPCRPYAKLTLGYGPLRIVEQTSALGTLALDLPRLAGVQAMTADLGDVALTAAVPPAADPAPGFVAISWRDGPPWGALAASEPDASRFTLGFDPADGTARTALIVTDGPVLLRVPVRPETCGTTQSATIATDAEQEALPLELTLPGCDATGQLIEIPLR